MEKGNKILKKWIAEDDDKRWHRRTGSSFSHSALVQESLAHSF